MQPLKSRKSKNSANTDRRNAIVPGVARFLSNGIGAQIRGGSVNYGSCATEIPVVENHGAGAAPRAYRRNLVAHSTELVTSFSPAQAEIIAAEIDVLVETSSA